MGYFGQRGCSGSPPGAGGGSFRSDEADLARRFTRIGRVATPQNSHIPGMGTRLHPSRELARKHRGEPVVRSEVGGGQQLRSEAAAGSRP
jgi:hypothetical protein